MNKKIVFLTVVNITGLIVIIVLFYLFINKVSGPKETPQATLSQPEIVSKKIDEMNTPKKELKSETKATSNNMKSSEPTIKTTDYKSKYGNLPNSLKGTEIDGNLVVDDSGKLIINKDIRYCFEYFLSASGEEPIETIRGRIEEYIQNKLPKEAAKEASDILDSYFKYKSRLGEVEKQSSLADIKDNQERLEKILEQRISVRKETMQPKVAEAFFAEEEAYDKFTLKCMALKEDKTLSDAEKEAKIIQFEEELPESYKMNRKSERERIELEKEVERLKKQGASIEEIKALRTKTLGPEVAERLSELDKERENKN
ncbi:MAG: hypothetical protein HQK79_05870 [Desulfobacterales bacterium]|nr:hypothetical protein [Desulfobacterales bacterium]MBF0396033.1 hypothetical protein [Desulfobacterales bacterium]